MNWDKDKDLDKLIEDKLGNFEDRPSPWVLEAVLNDVPAASSKGFSFLHGSGLIVTISSAFLVGTLALFYFLGYFDTASAVKDNSQLAKNELVKTIPGSEALPEIKEKGNTQISSNAVSKQTENQKIKKSPEKVELSNQQSSKQTITAAVLSNSKSQTTTSVFNKPLLQDHPKSTFEAFASIDLPSVMRMKRDAFLEISDNFMLNFLPVSRENFTSIFRNSSRKNYSYYAPNGNLAISMYFQADYLSSKTSENVASRRNLAGLGVMWSKNNFLLESGLIYCRENHDQKFNLNYNEFVGTYMRIDSIIFQVQNGQLTSTNVLVLDSVFGQDQKISRQITSSSYTYLNVPLLVGIEQQKSRFAFNIKTGFLMGIQVNKTEEMPVTPENSKISSVSRTSPVYLTTNLQWVLRAGINWYISDQYGLLLEPGVQGYLSKPYNPAEGKTDRPVYFGIKAGIFRKF